MTPEQQAKNDLIILHLTQAVEAGYSIVAPGSSDAVREAFPDFFATDTEQAGVNTSDELELDDNPMVSRSDDGCWVGTWSWVARNALDDPDYDDDGNLRPGVDNQ